MLRCVYMAQNPENSPLHTHRCESLQLSFFISLRITLSFEQIITASGLSEVHVA
jgi:hypothetical protein